MGRPICVQRNLPRIKTTLQKVIYFNLKSKGAIADITICERTYMSYDSTLAIYFSFFNSCILLFNDHYYYFVLFFFPVPVQSLFRMFGRLLSVRTWLWEGANWSRKILQTLGGKLRNYSCENWAIPSFVLSAVTPSVQYYLKSPRVI